MTSVGIVFELQMSAILLAVLAPFAEGTRGKFDLYTDKIQVCRSMPPAPPALPAASPSRAFPCWPGNGVLLFGLNGELCPAS